MCNKPTFPQKRKGRHSPRGATYSFYAKTFARPTASLPHKRRSIVEEALPRGGTFDHALAEQGIRIAALLAVFETELALVIGGERRPGATVIRDIGENKRVHADAVIKAFQHQALSAGGAMGD